MLLNSMLLLKAYILPQNSLSISSVQSLSRVQLFAPWAAARQASLSITNSQSLLKFNVH